MKLTGIDSDTLGIPEIQYEPHVTVIIWRPGNFLASYVISHN